MYSDDAMAPDDYVVDETYERDGNNYLLEFSGFGPNPELTAESERALAEIAAAINRNARHLDRRQFEMAITWLKNWKLGYDPTRREGSHREFHAILDEIRNSAEQRELQRKAAWKLIFGVVFGALMLLSLVINAVITYSVEDVSWGWKLLGAVVAIALFWFADDFLKKAQILAKEQDRRFGLESLRCAKTVIEVNMAGAFAYIPGTSADDPNFDEKCATQQMANAREALTDALYCDPDGYLARWRH